MAELRAQTAYLKYGTLSKYQERWRKKAGQIDSWCRLLFPSVYLTWLIILFNLDFSDNCAPPPPPPTRGTALRPAPSPSAARSH